MRILFGVVNAKGETDHGHGFTSKRVKKGIYEVKYERAFVDEPSVVATQVYTGNGDPRSTCMLKQSDESGFTMVTSAGTGKEWDRRFNFVVFGPSQTTRDN